MERGVVFNNLRIFLKNEKYPASPVGEADIQMRKGSSRALCGLMLGLSVVAGPASAQADGLKLGAAGYYEAPGVNVLVFSNWYDGLFADAKISGVELIQQGERTATNGDVRLSATPGQWDPIGRLVSRTVDTRTGVIQATLEYPDYGFRYIIRATPRGSAVVLSVELPQPVPAALVGKAGFNLEFLPAAYFHKSYMADGVSGGFPIYPADAITLTAQRNPASGRSDGPGAEPQPMANGNRFVLAPEDPSRHVTVTSTTGSIALYDGRDQAQNGWFVLRSLLPAGRTGKVIEWTLDAHSTPGWLRAPVIGHSQLGYAPGEAKVATIELDKNDHRPAAVRLMRVEPSGALETVKAGPAVSWGRYLRYNYFRFDFSEIKASGTYILQYGDTRTATFRIAKDIYADAWRPTNDVYFPVAMDHVLVNEAYRVWHGDSHRDDARQAPVNHEHIDLYAQGPSTDDRFAGGDHIPGLNVGGWYDAGDYDIRTQSQYAVVRSLVASFEEFGLKRDTVSVDELRRHVEIHVPDGVPDIVEQIRHGVIQLVAQFDSVGHAINGIVEPDVGEYTHLGDAASKTDGLIYDPSLKPGEERGGRSGTPDDRWAFTSKSSSLNYGSIAALAAASRALKGYDDALAAKCIRIAETVWREEQGHAPDVFSHGNTTGGPLPSEEFGAAVELLKTTRLPKYADAVAALWPKVEPTFAADAQTAVAAIPFMPASYREALAPAVRAYQVKAQAAASANPFGVPITTGGWAGDGAVMNYGLNAYALHKAYPEIVGPDGVFRAVGYLTGDHPGSDISFVSDVGTVSKEVAYGNNRADFTFIAGGVVPGVLVIKPDFPENHEDWPFFWGENEYVIPEGSSWIQLANAAQVLSQAQDGRVQ
ncbi:glycoside hydrolase family 9 protein [Caulobacter sp. S45]|uniref:glycoside hydrolase family 9 protein n=1 Tax=Caulobacter sp. S45 TaxID=1641861 RepID=UPI0020B11824|nr:glycoside hydrolase family 9 protein [Caulobacter sp. S45]